MASVSFERVTKKFGEFCAVRDVSLTVPHGEFLVVLGPSGCGKSTMLRMLAGLIRPTSGKIVIGDRDVSDVGARDRDIAFVFQSYALYPHMTVRRNLAFPLLMRGFRWWHHIPGVGVVAKRQMEKRPEVKDAVESAAAALGIDALLDRRPATLSGGQRQRVALGRAMVREPVVFLMDEPLSNLDANLRVQMRAELSRLHRQLDTTIVYVTHDQTEALSLGTSVLVLNGGEVQQFGSPREILQRPRNTFVAKFIGYPPMSLLAVSSTGSREISIGGTQLEPPSHLKGAIESAQIDPGGTLLLGVRPDHVELVAPGETGAVRGHVVGLESTGLETIVAVQVERNHADRAGDQWHGKITGNESVAYVRVPEYFRVAPDESVGLKFELDQASLFDGKTGLRLDSSEHRSAADG